MRVGQLIPLHGLWAHDALRDFDTHITLLHLGRGGVEENGTLDEYNQSRVDSTLHAARELNTRRPDLTIQIIFTGRCSRKQHLSGEQLLATEAGAAMAYAKTQLKSGDMFTMATEDGSTSTVENAVFTARNFTIKGHLIVISDSLHYMGGKIQSIMRTAFPKRELMFVELPNREGVTSKEKLHQLISAVTTRAGMAFVTKGDLIAIERRQKWMERWLEKLFRP